jgi:arabinofuranosyltransferase
MSAGVTALAIHMGYYILVIGGDHFEYRVLSYAVPLLPLSLLWLLNRAPMRPAAAGGILGLWILLSWPVPWTHWVASQRLVSRDETLTMRVSVAER